PGPNLGRSSLESQRHEPSRLTSSQRMILPTTISKVPPYINKDHYRWCPEALRKPALRGGRARIPHDGLKPRPLRVCVGHIHPSGGRNSLESLGHRLTFC